MNCQVSLLIAPLKFTKPSDPDCWKALTKPVWFMNSRNQDCGLGANIPSH